MSAAFSAVEGPPERYWERRREISQLASGVDGPPADIEYSAVEHEVWSKVRAALDPLWERYAARGVLDARTQLGLPVDRIPQLSEVNAALGPLTGFDYRAVDGLVPSDQFFGALARRRFCSTQFVRWEGSPTYTPEPDVIHEVMGHANCLACPQIAELHCLAGDAIGRLDTEQSRSALADVFWFSAEFGVIEERDEHRAYGAGLLSSPGELAWFADHARVEPLSVSAMARTRYDINVFQPVLFAGQSLDHVLDLVGGFFATATDEAVVALTTR